MFKYNIVIYERNAITGVKVDSLSYTLKLDESLDSGVLTIPRATRKNKFARFSRVEIKINDTEQEIATTWLIYTTKVEIDSKGATKTYNHTLGLIEPTKWLEKFIVGTLTFTQPLTGTQKTLYDYVERVRQLVPFVPKSKVNATRLFRIDSTFRSKINTVIAPQMYLDKKNLREVLIELFKVVNAIPRLYYDSGWILTGDFINQRQLEIEIGDGDIDYIQEASGENFAQSAEIFHENTIPDKENVIYEGSITDYITFRNNSVILGESDLRLVLTQPISELKNISLFAYTNDPLENDVIEISLNDYIFEKKIFDTKNFDGGKGTQAYSVYWTYKSNEILGFSQTYGGIFKTSAIERIYADIYGADVNLLEPSQWATLLFKVEYVPYYETMRSIQYRENFEPYALSPDLLDQFSAILINQGERINELYDLTENVYGQIQRLGVDTVSISKKHYLFSEVYNLGDYTIDGYIVTKVEIIPYTTYLIARYELSKNWNRIAQFIQIDKEFRPYEVSLTKSAFTLKRDVIFNLGFVEISNVSKTDIENDYSTLQEYFMNTFKTGTYNNNITVATLRPDYRTQRIVRPLGALAEKNALKWKVDMPDTKLVGKQVILNGNRRVQKAVYYTDSNGNLENIEFDLYNGIWDKIESNLAKANVDISYETINEQFVKLSNYLPLIETKWQNLISNLPIFSSFTAFNIFEYSNNGNLDGIVFSYDSYANFPNPIINTGFYFTLDTNEIYIGDSATNTYEFYTYILAKRQTPIFQLPDYDIKKDSAELLGLEIYLSTAPQYDLVNHFIIGDSLLKENALIKERETSKTLYFYGLTNPIEKTNTTKIDLSSATILNGVSVNTYYDHIEVPTLVYTNYDYYAIADTSGNLYLGVNQVDYSGDKTIISTIYFNVLSSKTYPEIDFETGGEYNVYFSNEFTLTMTIQMQRRIFNLTFENETTFTATSFLIYIAYRYSAYFENTVNLTATHAIGTYDWENSDVTYYNSATTKVTAYVDETGTPRPAAINYAIDTALRLYAYNMQTSNSVEYSEAGTQLDLSSGSITVSTGEDVEDVLEAANPTAFNTFKVGNMTDTVLKITDATLAVSYWKPNYQLHGYYKVIFVEI
jgi:hypothetical protein